MVFARSLPFRFLCDNDACHGYRTGQSNDESSFREPRMVTTNICMHPKGPPFGEAGTSKGPPLGRMPDKCISQ